VKKIFVGNFSFNFTEDQLRQLFEPFGAVDSASVVTDRDTGRSRGFGFVEMANDTEAAAAIEALNGKDSGGRALTVNEARPKAERSGGGGGGGGRGRDRGDRGGGGGGRGPRW
jgi:RNA recognition motif-containing protein